MRLSAVAALTVGLSQRTMNHSTLRGVTTRNITDFKNNMRRERGQAISTVNRALVTLCRFFSWLVEQGNIPSSP